MAARASAAARQLFGSQGTRSIPLRAGAQCFNASQSKNITGARSVWHQIQAGNLEGWPETDDYAPVTSAGRVPVDLWYQRPLFRRPSPSFQRDSTPGVSNDPMD